MAAAAVLNGMLRDSLGRASLSPGEMRRHSDTCDALCRVAGKVLQLLGVLADNFNDNGTIDARRQRIYMELLRCCISIFTLLVSQEKIHGSNDSTYFKNLAAGLLQYDSLNLIVKHANYASLRASLESPGEAKGREDLMIVEDALCFFCSVAEE